MFSVGKLEEFSPRKVSLGDVIDKLHSTQCFQSVNKEYVQKLKLHYQTFIDRMDMAVMGMEDSCWQVVCNEPKSKLKNLWKVKKELGKGPKSDEQKREETEKNLMQAMYYCLYIILFWRHEDSYKRYKAHVRTIEDFQKSYEQDVGFPRDRMDKWETLFCYRNVMILAAAIKPTLRNKGLFTKLACILSEDRIHTLGGGQSFAADRRGYIYDVEGAVYVARPSFCNNTDSEFVSDEVAVSLVTVSTPATVAPVVKSKKNKRRTSEVIPSSTEQFTESPSPPETCVPPTLCRINSFNPRGKKLTRSDSMSKVAGDDIIDLDTELDLLLHEGDFSCSTDNALMCNMSLNQLCGVINEKTSAASKDVSINTADSNDCSDGDQTNLHNAYVVGRAFSYNAYAYSNDHINTPLLGSGSCGSASETEVEVDDEGVSTSVSIKVKSAARHDDNNFTTTTTAAAAVTDPMDNIRVLASSRIDFSSRHTVQVTSHHAHETETETETETEVEVENGYEHEQHYMEAQNALDSEDLPCLHYYHQHQHQQMA